MERAKADGRWAAAYAGQARSEVPDDLRAALEADDAARAFFEVISGANRYAILYRISSVKKPETRAEEDRGVRRHAGPARDHPSPAARLVNF